MIAASWQYPEAGGVRCGLCSHACLISEGAWGVCRVRTCRSGAIVSPYLGRFSSVAVDPIEKKPLYLWRPGTQILSLGSVGCNMRCHFCQNHTIAQPQSERIPPLAEMSPGELVLAARRARTDAVAYTYNEPILQAEYIIAAHPILRDAGIATVLVTNGMISPEAAHDLEPCVDAANIDLKTFDPEAYSRLGGSLETVKATISRFVGSGVHVELTSLVVPGVNDSRERFAEMVSWIAGLSPAIGLHVTRYFPAFRSHAPATSISLMEELTDLARKKLTNVWLGNV